MLDQSNSDLTLIVAIAVFVFFAGLSWERLGGAPSWATALVTGAAIVIAIASLVSLLA